PFSPVPVPDLRTDVIKNQHILTQTACGCFTMAGTADPEPVTRFRRDMSIMGFNAYLILGLIAGAIAKAILPGKQGGGIFATLIIGVIGAMLGGWLGGAIFNAEMNEFFSLSTWLCAIGGSLIVLIIWASSPDGRRRRPPECTRTESPLTQSGSAASARARFFCPGPATGARTLIADEEPG